MARRKMAEQADFLSPHPSPESPHSEIVEDPRLGEEESQKETKQVKEMKQSAQQLSTPEENQKEAKHVKETKQPVRPLISPVIHVLTPTKPGKRKRPARSEEANSGPSPDVQMVIEFDSNQQSESEQESIRKKRKVRWGAEIEIIPPSPEEKEEELEDAEPSSEVKMEWRPSNKANQTPDWSKPDPRLRPWKEMRLPTQIPDVEYQLGSYVVYRQWSPTPGDASVQCHFGRVTGVNAVQLYRQNPFYPDRYSPVWYLDRKTRQGSLGHRECYFYKKGERPIRWRPWTVEILSSDSPAPGRDAQSWVVLAAAPTLKALAAMKPQ